MGIDFKKLTSKEFLANIDNRSAEDILSDISDEFIKFSKNKTINFCLDKKSGLKGKSTARVLNNWMKIGLVQVSEKDKGKIKRFDKLESIWLNILVEMRDFGMSIESIQRTRHLLFNCIFNDFSIFKFQVLNCIIREPQTLIIYKDGSSKIYPTDLKIKNYKHAMILPHLNFNLNNFIIAEYPNHSFQHNFDIDSPFDNSEKMKLLYFLRTGDFQFMTIKLSDGDIRYIENVAMLLKSKDVLQAFANWKFEEINISIDDVTSTIITSKV